MKKKNRDRLLREIFRQIQRSGMTVADLYILGTVAEDILTNGSSLKTEEVEKAITRVTKDPIIIPHTKKQKPAKV